MSKKLENSPQINTTLAVEQQALWGAKDRSQSATVKKKGRIREKKYWQEIKRFETLANITP